MVTFTLYPSPRHSADKGKSTHTMYTYILVQVFGSLGRGTKLHIDMTVIAEAQERTIRNNPSVVNDSACFLTDKLTTTIFR